MTNLTRSGRYVNPSSVYGYFDKIQAWLQVPATKSELAKLAPHCEGRIYAENRSARFNHRYRQRVELRQPDQEALQWLAQRDDAFINRIEIALDLIFDNFAERDDTWDFLQRRLIRRWHGRDPSVRFVGDERSCTRYDAARGSPNQLVGYCERYCRITGELAIIHLEWRCNRARAVRSAGIVRPEDVCGFPFRRFWRRRLLLVHVPDKEKLGRLVRNSRHKTRDRKPRINRHGHNHDCRLGHVLVEGRTTIQELADYVRPARIARLLQVIDNRPFLPPEETHSFCNYPATSFTTPQPP